MIDNGDLERQISNLSRLFIKWLQHQCWNQSFLLSGDVYIYFNNSWANNVMSLSPDALVYDLYVILHRPRKCNCNSNISGYIAPTHYIQMRTKVKQVKRYTKKCNIFIAFPLPCYMDYFLYYDSNCYFFIINATLSYVIFKSYTPLICWKTYRKF